MPAVAKRGWHLLSVPAHDAPRQDPDAEKHFIALKKAYEVLKDPARRERYDRTGSADEDSQSFVDAYECYRGVPLTEDDVSSFLSAYRNSEVEEEDLVAYFEEHEGDVSQILASIIGSSDADIPRFAKFFKAALASGRVRATRPVELVRQRSPRTRPSSHPGAPLVPLRSSGEQEVQACVRSTRHRERLSPSARTRHTPHGSHERTHRARSAQA